VRVGIAANQRLTIGEAGAPSADRARIQDFWRLYRAATAARVAGHVQAAERSYAAALELNPEHEDVLYYLGGMRLELGDWAAAAGAWRRLASLNANSARTQSQLATLYLCLEPGAPFQLDSAEAHLRRAHEINKEENGPILRLGEVALLRHDSASARRYFQTVLATHANNGPARFYTGYLEWKTGNVARAREEFARGSSAAVTREAVAGVASEGDTKSGAVAAVARGRCDDLRSLSDARSAADRDPGMVARYRSLDSLLTIAAGRAR
jgi:tetratricopeptide (TPR) repeat protein